MPELWIKKEDHEQWKIGQKVLVIEKGCLHRDFGRGKIVAFEINEVFNSYRIQVELDENPFDYVPFFPPRDVFKAEYHFKMKCKKEI